MGEGAILRPNFEINTSQILYLKKLWTTTSPLDFQIFLRPCQNFIFVNFWAFSLIAKIYLSKYLVFLEGNIIIIWLVKSLTLWIFQYLKNEFRMFTDFLAN